MRTLRPAIVVVPPAEAEIYAPWNTKNSTTQLEVERILLSDCIVESLRERLRRIGRSENEDVLRFDVAMENVEVLEEVEHRIHDLRDQPENEQLAERTMIADIAIHLRYTPSKHAQTRLLRAPIQADCSKSWNHSPIA